MRILILYLLTLSFPSASAQRHHHISPRLKTSRHHEPLVISKSIYLSFNPNSIFEPNQGAIGLGAGYRLNRRSELFIQMDYLYKGFYDNSDVFSDYQFDNLKGVRGIINYKYFYGRQRAYFTGVDLRVKRYSFERKENFENIQGGDTLLAYSYYPTHTLIGLGLFWGRRLNLIASGKFEMEISIGIGVKNRTINWRIPPGYSKIHTRKPDAPPLPDTDLEGATPYLPGVIKFIYHLSH